MTTAWGSPPGLGVSTGPSARPQPQWVPPRALDEPGSTRPELPLGRPSDEALWTGVAHTLREVVLPAVTDDFARMAVVQLVGLAQYAMDRGDDPTSARTHAVADALNQLCGNSLVDAQWRIGAPASAQGVMQAASEVLVACVARPADDPDAAEVRAVLRSLLVAHVDSDLAGNSVLLDAFRGRLPHA